MQCIVVSDLHRTNEITGLVIQMGVRYVTYHWQRNIDTSSVLFRELTVVGAGMWVKAERCLRRRPTCQQQAPSLGVMPPKTRRPWEKGVPEVQEIGCWEHRTEGPELEGIGCATDHYSQADRYHDRVTVVDPCGVHRSHPLARA